MVESQIVVLVVAGSNPVGHPNLTLVRKFTDSPLQNPYSTKPASKVPAIKALKQRRLRRCHSLIVVLADAEIGENS